MKNLDHGACLLFGDMGFTSVTEEIAACTITFGKRTSLAKEALLLPATPLMSAAVSVSSGFWWAIASAIRQIAETSI